MAYEGRQIMLIGAKAGADLSAATCAFKFVKFDTAPAVVLCDAVTDIPCGVLQAPAPSANLGESVQVCMLGVTKIQVDGVVTLGDKIGPNISGQAVKNLWGTDTTAHICGVIVNQDIATAVGAGGLATAMVNCINPPMAVTSA